MPLGAGVSMSALRQPKWRSAPVTPIRIVIRSRLTAWIETEASTSRVAVAPILDRLA
jgi:hypothetical protein